MATPTKEERQAKLRRFIAAAGVTTLVEIPTDGGKVYARDQPGGWTVEVNPYLGTLELNFSGWCKLSAAEQDRLTSVSHKVCGGHEFYSDKYTCMSPEEAQNWGKGTSREVNSDAN